MSYKHHFLPRSNDLPHLGFMMADNLICDTKSIVDYAASFMIAHYFAAQQFSSKHAVFAIIISSPVSPVSLVRLSSRRNVSGTFPCTANEDVKRRMESVILAFAL